MRGARGRVAAVVTAWLVALGVVLTGAVAPVATAAEGESSTTISLQHERWWQGEEISVDVVVQQDGEPAAGSVRLRLDGASAGLVRLSGGGAAHVTLPGSAGSPGVHVLEAVHLAEGMTTPSSSDTVTYESLAPTRPVVAATRVYGDDGELRVDLTGTDRPSHGEIEVARYSGEVLGTATLAAGAGSVDVAGTALLPGERVRITQRDTVTGEVLSRWLVSARVLGRPAALTIETAATWRLGFPAKVTVRASSDVGPVTGEVFLRTAVWSTSTRSATLVDGTAVLTLDPERLGIGTGKPLFVELASPTHHAPMATRVVTVKPRFQTWIDVDTRTYVVPWRYGTARRVHFSVTSETGARLDGKVTLSQGTRVLGTARIVDGKGSLLVASTALAPGRHRLDANFTPVSTRYGTDWHVERVDVTKAKPSVRLSMDHTWYRVKAKLGSSEAGRVRVSTAGLPERGRLVLETRSPRAAASGWRTRWSTDWALTAGDKGVQRVNVPATYLRTADGKPGKVYLRFRYVPSDPAHVSTVVSPAVTITRY